VLPELVVDGIHGPRHGGPFLPPRVLEERQLVFLFAKDRREMPKRRTLLWRCIQSRIAAAER
jgi:hypothetical protein